MTLGGTHENIGRMVHMVPPGIINKYVGHMVPPGIINKYVGHMVHWEPYNHIGHPMPLGSIHKINEISMAPHISKKKKKIKNKTPCL